MYFDTPQLANDTVISFVSLPHPVCYISWNSVSASFTDHQITLLKIFSKTLNMLHWRSLRLFWKLVGKVQPKAILCKRILFKTVQLKWREIHTSTLYFQIKIKHLSDLSQKTLKSTSFSSLMTMLKLKLSKPCDVWKKIAYHFSLYNSANGLRCMHIITE